MNVEREPSTLMNTETNAGAEKVSTVAVLLTCFNRRDKTLVTLQALTEQSVNVPRALHVILVDDGSRDGTADAARARFPDTELIAGSGSLFWNGGMRVAFARALEGSFDFYLWLNDDTVLAPHCLDTLLQASQALQQAGTPSIVTGSTCDPVTGERTYGGMRRMLRWNGVRDIFLEPPVEGALRCDTMNGNCVLIPAAVARHLGNLDQGFSHLFGDHDYGFRATRAGWAVHIAPGYLGTCPKNPIAGTWRDPHASLSVRWRQVTSRKGVPFADWFLFSRRHCGYLWPLYFVSPYLKVLLAGFQRTSKHSAISKSTG